MRYWVGVAGLVLSAGGCADAPPAAAPSLTAVAASSSSESEARGLALERQTVDLQTMSVSSGKPSTSARVLGARDDQRQLLPVAVGSVANAGAVVARMAAEFRRCYNRGLQEDAKMKGSVRITAKIGPNGEVLSASPTGGEGLSSTVVSCVAGVVSSRAFSPPEGGSSATIVIPVSFIPVE